MKTKNTLLLSAFRVSILFLTLFVFLFSTSYVKAQYCTATGGCDQYIANVLFNSINNTTNCDNYSDFSSTFTTNVNQGSFYQIKVSNPNDYGTADSCDVWVDWNQNSVFDNATEYYRLNCFDGFYDGIIQVPFTALIGQSKMRIRVRLNGITDPCGNASQFYGEVEDYGVNVTAATPMVFNSYSFQQFQGVAVPGSINKRLAIIKVVTNGSQNPLLIKNFQFNTLNSSTNISQAQLYYTGLSSVFSTQNQVGNPVDNPGSIINFNDSVYLLNDTNYFWLCYNVSNTAVAGSQLDASVISININDTLRYPDVVDTSGYIEVRNPLSGTYTINYLGTADYISFTDAVNDLKTLGISGPVVFNVDSGYYNEQISISSINGSSAINTITFQSSDSNYSHVVLEYFANDPNYYYTLELNNASNVFFKNLSLSSANNFNSSRVILINNYCENIGITGNRIYGNTAFNYGGEYAMIYISFQANAPDLLIENNIIENGYFGLFSENFNTVTNNNRIINNRFINQSSYGIYLIKQSNFTIKGNSVFSNIGNYYFNAILIESSESDADISKNRITVQNKNSSEGIVFYNFNGNINSLVSNNFISLNSFMTNQTRGIYFSYSDSLKIFNNSINIIGINSISNCIEIYECNGLKIFNNNMANNAGGVVYDAGFCLSCEYDYNNLFSNSRIAVSGETSFNILSDWIQFSNADSNSVSVNPFFISDTNLHTFNSSLNGKAIHLAEVLTDIDNENRNLTTPDIGADEFEPPLYDLQIDAFVNLPQGCGLTNNEKITLVVKNAGSAAFVAGNADVKFYIDLNQQFTTATIDRNIAADDTIHFTFPIPAQLSVNSYQKDSTFYIISWVDYSNDVIHTNDSIDSEILSKFVPAGPVVSDTTINYGSIASLNANIDSNYISLWYDSAIGGNLLKIGNPLLTPVLYNTDTFYVSAQKGGFGFITIGNDSYTQGYPFYTYYHDSKTQMIYTADELIATGLQPGEIKSISFNVSSRSSQAMNGFTIQMQNSAINSMSGFVNSGWTNVYSGVYTVAATGWQEIVFQNSFVWDGVSNILINICYNNSYYTSNSIVYSSYNSGKTWHQHADNSVGCSFSGGSGYSYRPNIKLNGVIYANSCESYRIPLIVNIGNQPSEDIGVVSINTPVSGFEITIPQSVEVNVKNFGSIAVDTFFVSYQINNGTAVTEMITDTLNPGNTINYSFNQPADISVLGSYDFKAFTTLVSDTTTVNDTATKNIINYTYCQPYFNYGCSYTSINDFVLGDIQNTSSDCNYQSGAYINYQENIFTTSLQKGVSYNFNVSPLNNYYYVGYAIWIDLNHDGDFNDTDECVYYSYSTSYLPISGTINISSLYSYVGKTRLRIRALQNTNLLSTQSCNDFSAYGETEDYTVTILPPPLQTDLELIQILKPDNSSYQLFASDFKVSVKNVGLDTLTQIPFYYKFNSDPLQTMIWNGIMLPQQQTDITFPQLTAVTSNNSLKVYAALSSDLNNSNDTLMINYIALPAPAVINISPDTIYGTLASCDSTANQNYQISISNPGYQTLYYSILQNSDVIDNFENGLSEWIYNGNWGIINQGYSSTNALTESPTGYYGNSWNQYIQLKDSLKIANKDSCKISYMLKRNMESCCDYLNTQISVNNSAWMSLSPSFNGNEDWTLKEFLFGNYVNIGDYIKFRFLFTSDGSQTGDGVIIDNFRIKGIEGSKWLTFNKLSDSVTVGNTSLLTVNMKVGALNAGNYYQVLNFLSNDPFSINTYIPVYLSLAGYPQILVKDSIKSFPSIMAGASATESFKIYNSGCDTLKIYSISNSNQAFTLNYNSFVLPKDSINVYIDFYSLTQGIHYDTLWINSNSSSKRFVVSGIILPTPKFVYMPDSFVVATAVCNDTITESLFIKNEGNTTMSWDVKYSVGAGKALSFNGINSEVQFGNFGSIPQRGSIEFWLKTMYNSGNRIIFSTSEVNTYWKGINIFQNGNYLYLLIGNDAGSYYSYYTITSNVSTNQWHHVAVSWDISQNSIWTYYDGNVYSDGLYNPNWPSTLPNVRLGAGYYNSSSYYFPGIVDELRIWREKRSQADIKKYMSQALIKPSTDLIGLWGFNESSVNTVYNFADNNFNGSLINVNSVVSTANIIDPGISIYPSSGVLTGGDSVSAQITFNTGGLNSGLYESVIGIFTNDPIKKQAFINTRLNLTGIAYFGLQSDILQVDSIMAGATTTDSLVLINTGCDTLKITSITHNNPDFVINNTALNIFAHDTSVLKITFNPLNVGNYYDTLVITSNIGNYNIYVSATAMAAPVASINPVSINDTFLICNQSSIKNLTIKNSGNEILIWNSLIENIGVNDNFNNGINNIEWSSISGGIAAASCGTALNSSNALYFNGDGVRQATTKSINTIGGGTISYYIKISGSGASPCEMVDNGEDIVFEYSINNGISWNNIQTLYAGSYSVFTLIQSTIPAAAQNLNTKFRWRQLTHSGSCCDHWSIDEVNINIINTANIIPSSGTIAVGDSVVVQMVLNAQNLINANYYSILNINTNDPLHPSINVGVSLLVNASPQLYSATDQIIMDTVMIGIPDSKQFYVLNTGCDTLFISNINKSVTEFSITSNSFKIPPKDSLLISITFLSNNISDYYDTLKIFSNGGNKIIILKGKSIGAPQVVSLPDFITADFVCDSQIVTPFKIKNPGSFALNWQAYVENIGKGALQFNGINNYVNINSSLLSATKWTVEAWVKPSDTSLGSRLIAGSIRNCSPWGLYMVDGKFAVIYRSASTSCDKTLIAVNNYLSLNTWYHVACTYNGSIIRLYINGQLVNSVIENAIYSANSSAFIGGDPTYGRYFQGSIDEVRIWNYARSQSQIYFSKNNLLNGNENGLKAYWTLNKLNVNNIKDISASNITGIVSGATFTENASPVEGAVELSLNKGITAVGDSVQLNLFINRHHLSQGSYPFKLIIQSDDPVKPYDTTIVTINALHNLIPLDIGADSTICSGNAITLNAGNYTSYLWSNGSISSSVTVSTTSNYFVNVTDSYGCKYTDSINLSIMQSPLADAGSDKAVCQGGYITLNATATGGTPPYQYSWRNSQNTVVSSAANYSFTPAQTSVYTLKVSDNSGCSSVLSDSVNVKVNPLPLVNAGNDTIIDLGNSVILNASINGGTYPYLINWSPGVYLSATNILNPVSIPTGSVNYYMYVTDANNCSGYDYVNIAVRYTVSGKLTYNNTLKTPMQNTRIYIANNLTQVTDSVNTNSAGDYYFSKVSYGNHVLFSKPQYSFGGVNATDALIIRRHVVGISLLSGVNLLAADVNGSNTVSSADALFVLRRTVGLISNFPTSDWVSDNKYIGIYANNLTGQNISVLCMGDVNASYYPFSTKSSAFMPDLSCENSVKPLIAGQNFDIAVRIKNDQKIGAVSLFLKFPGNKIEILDVKSMGNNIEFNVSDGLLKAGFFNENGINIINNELLTLKCKLKPEVLPSEISLFLLENSEIADVNGNPLAGIVLETSCFSIVENLNEFRMEDISPNPFSNTSNIRLFVPEQSIVQLSIINMLGEKIKTKEIKTSIGWNDITVEGGDLSEGIYMYNIQATSDSKKFDHSKRMLIIR